MPFLFTKQSLAEFQKKIAKQQGIVKNVGKEVGEEAGINCDWHDNFGFEEARRRLELESRRLKEMLDTLAESKTIEIVDQNEIANIGCTVVFYLGSEERTYTIGAYGETDPDVGLVSYATPIGAALYKKRVGDISHLSIDNKPAQLEIVEILPPSYRYTNLRNGE